MKKEQVPQAILNHVQQQLHPDEELLWVGLPDWNHVPDTFDSKSRQMMRGLFAYWLGLAGIALLAAQGNLSPLTLVVMVILIAGAILFAGIIGRMFSAQRKVYALTSQRALVISGKRIQSYDSADIEFIERVMHADGSGDILFKHAMLPQTMMIGPVAAEQKIPQSFGFFGIQHPQQVEELMLEIFRAQAETRTAARLLQQPVELERLYDRTLQQAG